MNSGVKGDVTPVVSDDVERSRPHAHSRNLFCQISVDQGRRFRLNHTEIRVNIRANGGFKLLQASVGRSRGPSCPFMCVPSRQLAVSRASALDWLVEYH